MLGPAAGAAPAADSSTASIGTIFANADPSSSTAVATAITSASVAEAGASSGVSVIVALKSAVAPRVGPAFGSAGAAGAFERSGHKVIERRRRSVVLVEPVVAVIA